MLPKIPNDIHLLNSYRKIALAMTKILVTAVINSTNLQSAELRIHLISRNRTVQFQTPPPSASPSPPDSTPSLSTNPRYPTPVSFDSASLGATLPSRASWPSQDSVLPQSTSSSTSMSRQRSSPLSNITVSTPQHKNFTNIVHKHKASLATKKRVSYKNSSKKITRVSSGPITKFLRALHPPRPKINALHQVDPSPPRPGPELEPVQQSTAIT